MKWLHSQAWLPTKKAPPITVRNNHRITPFLSMRCPASTASTMVTELKMRMAVMRATYMSG